MTIQECLAKNLKFYRKKKQLTQGQLAEKCNTSTNYIALIESEKKYPSQKTLEKIAKALEINAIDLFQIEIKNNKTTLNHELEQIKEDLRFSINKLLDDVLRL
jgi:transcriptional regulator with XRE-family HTH domain